MTSRLPRIAFIGCIAALCGCSFESTEMASPGEMNMCTTASDCADGSDCVDGMCQAQEADMLKIALQVTPLHMPNGDESLPILLDAFRVTEPVDLPFHLPTPMTVGAKVRSGDTPAEAEVTFTPTITIPGITPAAVTASVTANAAPADHDYDVHLLRDVEYHMVVRPKDMSTPPFAKTFTAGDNADLNVDFTKLETTERAFAISGAPSDRDLIVTAFDTTTGEAISSTGMLSAGKVALKFVPGTELKDYRLEIRASNAYDGMDVPATPDEMPCDTDTPAFPVFSISSTELGMSAKIALPPQPQRIRYEGTVELCPDEANDAGSITDLPITLHAQMLLFEKDTKLGASFDTTTSAKYDKQTKALHFCVEVMPGEYDVVATPPASMRCALFAERKMIKPPTDDTDIATGALLSLPQAAYLGGTLLTMGPAPVSGASVDAIALGRSGVIDLPPGDLSVTRYNRSSQTTTNSDGSFRLPVDLGSYDIVIKPPVDSGFPWQVNHDIEIGLGARKTTPTKTIDMPSPVVVTGTLSYKGATESTQATLNGAEIDAFAIISDGNKDPDGVVSMRAVAIGKTTADEQGEFMLLLPPETQHIW